MNEKPELGTIHYSELLPMPPGEPLAVEYEFYRREVGRLIAEGHEGKHILIKGEEILGIFDTHNEAIHEGNMRFLVEREPFFVRQILTREKVIRLSRAALAGVDRLSKLRSERSANGAT